MVKYEEAIKYAGGIFIPRQKMPLQRQARVRYTLS